ncbi:glycoside hydrolase family 9 protein [Planctomyces sp. SH-PL62]|uniref:glycoside hydrolase family 9 protein n=1 Tax=Planctomyces sp. SH-PL62 TaxID=1636152 RepID=UPI00078D93C3|nr:glycoside hydrolase family 9 protein [Planctomyces sp. SH-PL62]AMV40545.1 Endoglucanase E-4 precursor [Planctomyces sp. SH-PL62]
MRHLAERKFAVAVAVFVVASSAVCGSLHAEPPAPGPGPWLRVNQVGYLPDDPKIAVLSGPEPLAGSFRVGDFAAEIGPDQGAWGPFAHNYRLDFSAVRGPGRYRVRFGAAESAEFAIGPDAYAGVPDALLRFMQIQRCGDDPIAGEPKCHLQDAIDVNTGEKVDLVGGWHDAADRLKHMITTSYCVAALRLVEHEGAQAEARHGAPLIKKLHPKPDVIYVQIGDDRDHRPPQTLWHDDRSDYGWGPGGPRSAWPATGKPEGPKYKNASTGKASLAGRCAATMALMGDLDAARSMYKLAQDSPGVAMSVPVLAPHYYGESTYLDDLEWGAAELYRATREPKYLAEALDYADQAGDNAWMGRDAHGHYEFFPYVNLGHWRIHEFADEAAKARLAGYYRTGLERIRDRAMKNPYRIGTPIVWCSTNDVIAFATQARLYEKMSGDDQFRSLAAEARDWIFGRNPWGVSFVIGVPEGGVASSRPHHMFHRLANRSPVGGLVDGPVTKAINDSLKFSAFENDPLAPFQSDFAVYHDEFADFSTNEPIIDGTVSLWLLLDVWR